MDHRHIHLAYTRPPFRPHSLRDLQRLNPACTLTIARMDPKQHWDTLYSSEPADDVSWFQKHPALSLLLIQSVVPDKSSPIIDVGAGASVLVDCLLDEGYKNLAVLDVARYDAASICAELGKPFQLIKETRETHQTPWGAEQKFVYFLFRKVSASE
jgi:hypothetical protein